MLLPFIFKNMTLSNLFVEVTVAHRLSVAGCGVFSSSVPCLDPWPLIPPRPLSMSTESQSGAQQGGPQVSRAHA